MSHKRCLLCNTPCLFFNTPVVFFNTPALLPNLSSLIAKGPFVTSFRVTLIYNQSYNVLL